MAINGNGTKSLLQKMVYTLIGVLITGVFSLIGIEYHRLVRDIDDTEAVIKQVIEDARAVREEQKRRTVLLEWMLKRLDNAETEIQMLKKITPQGPAQQRQTIDDMWRKY